MKKKRKKRRHSSLLGRLKKRVKGKGRVKNHSSKSLWVIENDTKGYPVARKLGPKRKTPKHIDADAFKRFDGMPLEGHRFWWKIWGHTTANVYDRGNGLKVSIVIKFAVPEDHFRPGKKVEYNKSENWGEPIRNIDGVKKNKKGNIIKYHLEGVGWISKSKAISMTQKDQIDNAVLVKTKDRKKHLRSRPDDKKLNNFSEMV